MKSILIIILFTLVFATSGKAQGELLNFKQLGPGIAYETVKIGDVRSKAFRYSYTIYRLFEIGGSKFSYSDGQTDNKGFESYLAFFLNSKSWFHMKGSIGLSSEEDNTTVVIRSTLFASNSRSDYKLVPSLSLLYENGEIAYSGGLNFKLGGALSLTGGIKAIKYKGNDLALSLSIGLLMAEPNKKVQPEEVNE